MSDGENPNLHTDDPALAVVIDRILNLSRSIEDSRLESRAQINALRVELKADVDKIGSDLKEVQGFMRDLKLKFTMAKGGYIVIATLIGFAAWGLGIWEKLYKILH